MKPAITLFSARARRALLRLFLIVLLPGLFSIAAAACPPAAGGTPNACGGGPASQGNTSGTQVGAGNPLNVITGNKYQREVDMPALPGVLGLEIVRHYNSAYSGPKESNGLIGRGWKLSYETVLQAIGSTLQIVEADGTRVIFDRDAQDPGHCHSANPASGSMQIDKKSNGSEEYRWTWIDGRKLHFDASGKLASIVAPGGQFVSLIYDNRGVLVKVIDPQGRSLTLSYLNAKTASREGRFAGVQMIDSPLGRFHFDYGSAAPKGSSLPDPRILWATLVQVSSPEGKGAFSHAYHYEDAQWPTLLTGISIRSNEGSKPVTRRYATFAYDASARAVLSTHAGNVGKVVLEHGVGKTRLTNSLGQSTLYRHTVIAGEYRLLEVRGAGCSTCGETNVRYQYDHLARLTGITRLTSDGLPLHTTRTELDNIGRTLAVVRIQHDKTRPGRAQPLLRYEYAGSAWQPSLIARPSVVPGREAITRIAYNDQGQLLTVTDSGWAPAADGKSASTPIQRSTSYRYRNIKGRSLLFEIDGPLKNGKSNGPQDSDLTRIDWDRGGNRVLAMTVPGNLTSTAQYDDAGRISALVSTDGNQTAFRYNAQQQLIAAISSDITQSARYDAQGNLVEIGYGEGDAYKASAHLGADATGSNTWIASHPGIVTRQRHDTEGRLLEASTASASFMQTQRYVYDALGRLIAATDAAGGTRRIRYNDQSLPGVVEDALGRETRLDYDAEGNLVALMPNAIQPSSQDNVTRFSYDSLGQVNVVVAPNGATTRTIRDDFGRTIAIISHDSGIDTKSYDAAGRITASVDARGNRASYEYDVTGRIVKQTVVDANAADPAKKFSVTLWKYQGARLIAIAHPEQSERYRYDAQRRLSAKTVILAPAGAAQVTSVARYRYDALGQIVSTSLPDGSSIDIRRNGQNQVIALKRSRIQTPWLKWLLPDQSMVHDLERDIAGLRSATYGNGMQALFQRSREGVLTRIFHRAAHGGEALQQFDHRYQWDPEGNLLHVASKDGKRSTSSHHAYDEQDRLIATGTSSQDSGSKDSKDNSASPLPVASYSRYFHDGAGNRVLAQEGIADQSDTGTQTIKTAYAAASNRWQGAANEKDIIYDSSGQPSKIGRRNYLWNALGQLIEVQHDGHSLASYRYNHQGQRIGKTTQHGQIHYLYDDQHLMAELNSQGKITRQYVYLGDQAIAVIDSPDGKLPVGREYTPLQQIAADLGALLRSWFSGKDAIAYLHNNHLGATELVTDDQGEAIWQASYSPYGKIVLTAGSGIPAKASFKFNLRLPGQYQDDETGLYYNHHRYYDPARGQYLTPDPLGLRGGINAYAYAASNPLKYIDPSGLILFAFDGTGNNSDPNSENIDSTNVALMHKFYDDTVAGQDKKFYQNGIGSNPNSSTTTSWVQQGFGLSAKEKIHNQLSLFFVYINRLPTEKIANKKIMIDVVGFSRGAAEAREFSNTLIRNYKSGVYGKACLEFRFMGLYDTVAQFGSNGSNDGAFDMTIAPEWTLVAQAYALNEHRPLFPLQSIQGGSGGTRIEQGFIGAHADIGGGYNDTKEKYKGDLSDVALMWMVRQAETAGVKFTYIDDEFRQVTRPILHEQRNNGGAAGVPTSPGGIDFGYRNEHVDSFQINLGTGEIIEDVQPASDREVRFPNGGMKTSGNAFGSQAVELEAMIKRAPNWERRTEKFGYTDNCVGAVDMKKYREWLQKNLNLRILPAVNESSSVLCKVG